MYSTIKTKLLLQILIFLCYSFPAHFALADEEDQPELTDWEKLNVIAEQIGENIPCHELKVKYNQSFPAWTVGAMTRGGTKLGDQVTSQEYKDARFKPITRQYYQAGMKKYFKPAYYFDFTKSPDPEFVGFIAYRVALVSEPYKPQKHDAWGPISYPDWVPGETPLKPAKIKKNINHPRHTPNYKKYIVYERCFEPQPYLPYDTNLNVFQREFPDFPFQVSERNGKTYLYGENDTPTFFGYYSFFRVAEQEYLDFLDSTITGMVIIRDMSFAAIPVVGSALSIKACMNSGDAACWSGAALDIASDVAIFLKIGKFQRVGQKLLNAVKETGDAAQFAAKVEKYADKTLYLAAYGNATLGAFYLKRGEVLEGLVRIGAGGGDIMAAHIDFKGLFGGKVGKAKGQCAKDPVSLEFTEVNVDTDSIHITSRGVAKEIIEPPNALSKGEYYEYYWDSITTHPGIFEAPVQMRVRRVDTRNFDEIVEAGGCFPKSDAPRAKSLADHVDDATGSFVSTTHADNVDGLLDIGAFFPFNNKLNYNTPGELDNFLGIIARNRRVPIDAVRDDPLAYGIKIIAGDFKVNDSYIPWNVGDELPPPVRFETWEYEADTLAIKVDESLSGEEQEAIVRAMRLDEMTGARRHVLELEWEVTDYDPARDTHYLRLKRADKAIDTPDEWIKLEKLKEAA